MDTVLKSLSASEEGFRVRFFRPLVISATEQFEVTIKALCG